MIWHIFKKDWKLLWLFVAIVALLNWVAAAILFKVSLFGEDSILEMLAEQLPIVATFAMMFLVVAIVHLDAVPGLRQDWLVRPIRRRDLLAEKLLFVILTVEGPVFLANLFQGLANHFSVHDSLAAAAWRVVFLLLFFVLPIFILASVTQNMTEAFIFGCGCTFIIGVFLTLSSYANDTTHGTLDPVLRSGVGWIGEVFRFGMVTVSAAVILSLQFFRRKTLLSRVLVVTSGLLLLFSMFFPWGPAFAVQQRLSPNPAAAADVALAFEPSNGRFRPPSGLSPSENNRDNGNKAELFLPLRIKGLHSDGVLLADRAEVRLISSDGRVVYHGNGEDMEINRSGQSPILKPAYQEIVLPESVYNAHQDQPLQVELDYSLTVFALAKSYSISALNGDERMPGWGWCQTKMNDSGTVIELRCMQAGRGPICGSAFLENATSAAHNPERSACISDYTPFGDRPIPDNFARFGLNIPFRDPSGLAKYPVDGPQLPQSRVVIRVYQPEAHFARSVVIPELRLKDWEAQ